MVSIQKVKVKVCRYCGWWRWWNQVHHPGEGHDKAELYLQPSLSRPILCHGCLEAWRSLIWSFPLPVAPHAEFFPCADTGVCDELLKNTEETLPYKGSKRCLRSLNYSLHGCLNPGTQTRRGNAKPGKNGTMAISIWVSCLTAKFSLKGWSHHSFMLTLRHFFTKSVRQIKSAEK